jgi:hypothetical protein
MIRVQIQPSRYRTWKVRPVQGAAELLENYIQFPPVGQKNPKACRFEYCRDILGKKEATIRDYIDD